MSIVDPISDLITRIRNAQMARKPSLKCPLSKLRVSVLKILLDEGYIRGYSIVKCDQCNKDILKIELKYFEGDPVINEIKRVSKPGRRSYSSIKKLPWIRNGLGMSILSTNRGVMSDTDARKQSIGGEIICSVF
jgi:small subunit ribosomal protein S8